jgi:hypothetical protein
MQLDSLKQKLIAAARQDAPSDRVPFAFEKRIMARLAGAGVPDGWILWSRALWRAAIPCFLIVVFSGLWSVRHSLEHPQDLSQQIEDTVLSELNQNLASIW